MTLRTGLAALMRFTGELSTVSNGLTQTQPAPGADSGPSTRVVMETVAHHRRGWDREVTPDVRIPRIGGR